MFKFRFAVAALVSLWIQGGAVGSAIAGEETPDAPVAASSSKDAVDLPPFPPDATVKQVSHVAGKTLSYTATVGSLPVRDEKGRKIAEVVFTAYVLDGPKTADRPVTFAFNGGPGAASVYLNLGAIGPKRVPFGAPGDSPSDPARLGDNPGTWLDFTDLVFIDPVGTGFSRSLLGKDDTARRFYSVQGDVTYLSRIVYDWLLRNGRTDSPKYLVGESYGGFRVPAIARQLQRQLGVAPRGLLLISPFLDARISSGAEISPLPYVVALPSEAAAYAERQGRPPTPDSQAEVEAYARGEFVVDLLKGDSDPAAIDRIVEHVTRYTGLNRDVVKKMGGRLDVRTVLRELYRDQQRLAWSYDTNVTGWDPSPWAPQGPEGEPILAATVAPTTTAMVGFATRTVGWRFEGPFNTLSSTVNEDWERGWSSTVESVKDLRTALATDPKLKVFVAHGYGDLAAPYFASRLILDRLPRMETASRVSLSLYPGGHMFYSRPASQAQFRRDVEQFYGSS
jgi:carboxypeptidase C (cathepsin A)